MIKPFRLLAVLGLLMAGGSCTTARGPLTAPGDGHPALTTRAGGVLEEFITAYNTGLLEPMTLFFIRHGTETEPSRREQRALERAKWVVGFVNQGIRQFDRADVVSSSDLAVTVLGTSRLTGAAYRFTIEVDPEPSQGVAFGFENGDPPHGRPEGDPVTQARRYVDRIAREDFFSGTVLVSREGSSPVTMAYGYSDRAALRLNASDTRFNLGSMNKMFTAVAISQLDERGRLSVEDAVARHLPDYPNADVARNVTIHHLLTHTSGLGDFFTPEYLERRAHIDTLGEILPFFANDPLAFRPGEKWQYSNAGFIVLGLILEAVSGQSYYDYVRDHVFIPAGMLSSGSFAPGEAEDMAAGYTFARPGGGVELNRAQNGFALAKRGSAGGGGYSTVGDLLRFHQALRSHELVSAATLSRMLTPHARTDRGTEYGYGFEIWKAGDETVFGHNGHHFGISAQLEMFLKSGDTVVVLSNYDPPAAPIVAERLRSLLLP